MHSVATNSYLEHRRNLKRQSKELAKTNIAEVFYDPSNRRRQGDSDSSENVRVRDHDNDSNCSRICPFENDFEPPDIADKVIKDYFLNFLVFNFCGPRAHASS